MPKRDKINITHFLKQLPLFLITVDLKEIQGDNSVYINYTFQITYLLQNLSVTYLMGENTSIF